MGSFNKVTHSSTKVLFSTKAAAFETTLRQNLESYKELILDVEAIQQELETCKRELLAQRQNCERKKCCSSEFYEKILETKNNIIQSAVATALRIDETKNLSMVSSLLRILCGEVETLTPPKDLRDDKENLFKSSLSTPNKKKIISNTTSNKSNKKTPKKELDNSTEDVSFKDESVSEIDGTPGRTSPIIQTRKMKSYSSISSLSGASTDSREKKKCPENWSTPERKQVKLCYPSPKNLGKGKLRQGRFSFVATKPSLMVDLTSSPEISRENSGQNQNLAENCQNPHVQLLIKQESSENDDTILPSPTSGPTNCVISKTSNYSQKFKNPLSIIKKQEEEEFSPIIQVVEKKHRNTSKDTVLNPLEESINILKQTRFAKSPQKATRTEFKSSPLKRRSPLKDQSLMKTEKLEQPGRVVVEAMNDDVTHCESSMSILQQVNKLELHNSPSKRPLAENQNVVNFPTEQESMSLLQHGKQDGRDVSENKKRKVFEKVEPVYKEPTVRKKAEKLALPAWCCDQCRAFFSDLYENDAEKIKTVIDRCSKHRGRNNPVRPKTPDGFWYPRWEVPEDTEEFNRRNNAN